MLPAEVRTERLDLRRPRRRDAQAIFDAYASDPDVARNLTWATHRSLEDTHRFLDQCDRGWQTGADQPYLAWKGGSLVGATGLTRVGARRFRVGFVVAKACWGDGFAAEMLGAMVGLAFGPAGADAIEALVEPGHERSAAVLRRARFAPDGQATGVHPNLGPEIRRLDRFVLLRQD